MGPTQRRNLVKSELKDEGMEKKILISGASGLVGSNLINHLCNTHDVYALVKSLPNEINKKITYFEINLEDPKILSSLPKTMDIIVHLAQSNCMRDFPIHAMDIFNVNVKYTALLLNYGAQSGVKNFIYASTGGLYGTSSEVFEENSEVKINDGPLSYYFRSKLASESLILGYSYLMNVTILRPFFIYGRHQKPTMLLPRLLQNINENKAIQLQGEAGIFINPVHVSDVINLIKNCLTINKNLTVNVAGPEILSIRAICEMLGSYLGKKPLFKQVSGEAGNIVSNTTIMRSINKTPMTTFAMGMTDLI